MNRPHNGRGTRLGPVEREEILRYRIPDDVRDMLRNEMNYDNNPTDHFGPELEEIIDRAIEEEFREIEELDGFGT